MIPWPTSTIRSASSGPWPNRRAHPKIPGRKSWEIIRCKVSPFERAQISPFELPPTLGPFPCQAFAFDGEFPGQVILPPHADQSEQKFLLPDAPFGRVRDGRQRGARGGREFRHQHGGQMIGYLHAARVRGQFFRVFSQLAKQVAALLLFEPVLITALAPVAKVLGVNPAAAKLCV